jgi:hypothetical protein
LELHPGTFDEAPGVLGGGQYDVITGHDQGLEQRE